MTKTLSTKKRILSNTIFLYSSSLFKIVIGLWTTRWVLNSLGQDDFGLYTVIGAILIFITFFNNVLSGSASRHIAYAIGKGDSDEVTKWFNTILSTHLILASSLTLLGWIAGEYYIKNHLIVPSGREEAALIVFRISLASLFISMASVPYNAMFIAKQKMGEISIWTIFQTSLIFLTAFSLLHTSYDKLVYYALCITLITVVIQTSKVTRATIIFKECRLKFSYFFCRSKTVELFNFAIWNLIGSLGLMLRGQGTAILINQNFGTKVNAAFGIANQVTVQTSSFSTSLMNAFNPEIVSREGRGDRQGVISLSLKASRLSTLLIMIFVIPLCLEIDYVLKLWLSEPPAHASTLVIYMLITFVIDRLSIGFMMAVNATGKIAAYQATLGSLLLSTVFIIWYFYHIGLEATSAGIAFVLTTSLITIGRALWVKYLIGITLTSWIKKVILPCFLVMICSTAIGIITRDFFDQSFIRLCIVTMICTLTYIIFTWLFALESSEQSFIKNKLSILYIRLISN